MVTKSPDNHGALVLRQSACQARSSFSSAKRVPEVPPTTYRYFLAPLGWGSCYHQSTIDVSCTLRPTIPFRAHNDILSALNTVLCAFGGDAGGSCERGAIMITWRKTDEVADPPGYYCNGKPWRPEDIGRMLELTVDSAWRSH